MSSLKVLEICKSWGMSNPNDIRDWMKDVDELIELEIKKRVEEEKQRNNNVMIKAVINHHNSEVNDMMEIISPVNDRFKVKKFRGDLLGENKESILNSFEEHCNFCEQVDKMLIEGIENGCMLENGDWLEIEQIKLQLISKKMTSHEGRVMVSFGFIKF